MNNLQKTRVLAGLRAPFLAKILQAPGRLYMCVEKGSMKLSAAERRILSLFYGIDEDVLFNDDCEQTSEQEHNLVQISKLSEEELKRFAAERLLGPGAEFFPRHFRALKNKLEGELLAEAIISEPSEEQPFEEHTLYGDSSLEIEIDGEVHACRNFSEVCEVIPFKNAVEGFRFLLMDKREEYIRVGKSWKDSDGTKRSAWQISERIRMRWCPKCGRRRGDGTNGTCRAYAYQEKCAFCGQLVRRGACHTCARSHDESS